MKETEWAKVCEYDRYCEGDRSQGPFLLDNNSTGPATDAYGGGAKPK
jgi:hypothetical protein